MRSSTDVFPHCLTPVSARTGKTVLERHDDSISLSIHIVGYFRLASKICQAVEGWIGEIGSENFVNLRHVECAGRRFVRNLGPTTIARFASDQGAAALCIPTKRIANNVLIW